MTESFQNEVPKARINLKLDLHTGGSQQKIELPLKLLVIGDYGNGRDTRPVAERQKLDVNRHNFDDVLDELRPRATIVVGNTLKGGADEMQIALEFRSMYDFTPEAVAARVPELRALVAARNLLRDLKSNLLDNARFRRELEKILKDPVMARQLRTDLSAIAGDASVPPCAAHQVAQQVAH